MRCRCVLARFHHVGVLSSASRPCRPHFFVAPHPATPNNKKGYLSVTFFYYWSGQWDWCCRCVLARFHLVGVLSSASRPCRPHFFVAPHPATPNNKKGYLSVTFFYYWSGQWDSDPRHQPWQPKKSYKRWLLWAFYHVNFTDIGMFSHIVDIINFGIGFSIF